MDKGKMITLRYIAIFLGLLVAYYYAAGWITKHFFQPQPEPEAATLGKYVISRVADFAEFDHFTFSIPLEFKEKILLDVPNFPEFVPMRLYHRILDYEGAGYPAPHKTIFYVAFPWYLLVVFLFCFVRERYKQYIHNAATPQAKKEDVYIRGVRRVDPVEFCKLIKKAVLDPVAEIVTDGGKLFFSANRLREHMAIFGASGTGKSQFLLAFLASFFANIGEGTRAVIIDRKGEFWAYFGTSADIIFNPFDARSVKWSLFNELDIPADFDEEPPDVRAISKILFPGNGKDPFWENSAADVFCSAVAVCIKRGTTTNKDLVNFCNDSADKIIKAFKDLPVGLAAGRVLGDNPTSPTVGSILSTLKTGLHPLSVCEDGDFSVKDWIRNSNGNLYLSSAGKNDTVFIPVLTILFDMIGREIKEMPDSGGGGVKYLFCIDELAAYPKLNTLHYLVAEARSKGVCTIIATQTIQKVLQVYGDKEGRDVLGNTKTKVIFRTIEADDARYLSKTIGSSEVQRVIVAENENSSVLLGRVDGREGMTKTKQIVNEAVFLTGDLQTLETGNSVVIHPAAGEAVAKLKFEPFRGKKRRIEFDPIREKTVSARDFGEMEKQRAAAEAEKKKAEEAKRAAEAEQQRKKDEKEMIDRLFPKAKKKEPESKAAPEKEDRQPLPSSPQVDKKPEATPEKGKEEEQQYNNYLL